MTYWGDELVILMSSPHLTLDQALQPHDGHLILTSRLVYKASFEVFGSAYLPLQLLTVSTILATVGLLFSYLSRRVGPWVALAPCLGLLVFGSDSLHVVAGNGFIVLSSVACGIGALLALEARTRRGDAAACALLVLGVASYSVALAFVVGATVAILLDRGRVRRLWVVGLPAALYGAWWLWSLSLSASSDDQVSLLNALVLPAWAYQSLSATLSALSGLDFSFSGPGALAAAPAGAALAVLAFIGLGLRLAGGRVSRPMWAALAVLISLWLMGALTATGTSRSPSDPRYLFPWATAVLLVAAAAAEGTRWSRRGLVALYVVAAIGLAANLFVLRETAAELRGRYTVQTRAAFTALDLAGDRTPPGFKPPPPITVELPWLGVRSPLTFPFDVIANSGGSPSRSYLAAADRYGSVGFSSAELEAESEASRAQADSVLVAALGLHLVSVRPGHGASCGETDPDGDGFAAPLPPGGTVLEARRGGTEVQVRRFADTVAVRVGRLAPGGAVRLRIPLDASSRQWSIYAADAPLAVCQDR